MIGVVACLLVVLAAPQEVPPEPAPPAPSGPRGDPPAAAQVRIVHRVHPGLVYSVEELRRKHLRYVMGNVAGEDGKAREVPAEVEQVSREAWTDTIRETAGGRPTKLERHYHARTAYERHHTTTQDLQVRRPLHGRTLELRSTAAGVRVRAMSGTDDLDPKETGALRLLPAVVAFLPEKPVAVGQRWRLTSRAVGRLLGSTGGGPGTQISGAFASLKSVRVETLKPGIRHRIAVLEVEFALATRLRADLVLESKLRGTIRVDLTAQQLMRADLTGTLTAKSDPDRLPKGAVSVQVSGEVAVRVLVRPGRLDPGRVSPRGSGR